MHGQQRAIGNDLSECARVQHRQLMMGVCGGFFCCSIIQDNSFYLRFINQQAHNQGHETVHEQHHAIPDDLRVPSYSTATSCA